MSDVATLVLPFFGLILLGYLAGRLRGLDEAALGWMNFFIVYVSLPALFFRIIGRTPIADLTRFDFILTSLAATYSVFLIAFAYSRFSRNSVGESTVQALAAAYGNIGYLAPGLALSAFGPSAGLPLALIFAFENTVHFIVTPALMALDGGNAKPARLLAAEAARRIITHPFIVATIAGFIAAAAHFTPPAPIEKMIDSLSMAAAPCALFAMGVTLALRPLKRAPADIGLLALLKLVLLPVIMYLAMSATGDYPAVWVETAVLLAALPTATNVFVIAQQYGIWQERASATVLITTVLSVASVSAIIFALKSGALPPDLFP